MTRHGESRKAKWARRRERLRRLAAYRWVRSCLDWNICRRRPFGGTPGSDAAWRRVILSIELDPRGWDRRGA